MDMMSYLMGRNSGGAKKGAKIEVVTELPETGEANVIYLVPKQDEDENNVFDEYLYINNEWELIGSTAIDISGKQDTMQFSTMPVADSTTVGKIIQYVGTTTNDYTNGYFYIGTTDGEATPTYSWENIDIQEKGIDNFCTITLPSSSLTNFKNLLDTYEGASGWSSRNTLLITGTNQTIITNFLRKMYNENNDDFKITIRGMTVAAYTYGKARYQSLFFGEQSDYGTLSDKPPYTYLRTFAKNSSGRGIQYGLHIYLTWDNDILTASRIELRNEGDLAYLAKGNDVEYIPTTNFSPATKKYVDDNKGQTIQYETMPTASADYVGKIVQYTGTTDSNYTNGYFYVCVSETENDVTTYSWSNLNVQDGADMILLIDDSAINSTSSSGLNTDYNKQQILKLIDAVEKGKQPIILLKCKKDLGINGNGSIMPVAYSAKKDTTQWAFSFTTDLSLWQSSMIYNYFGVQYSNSQFSIRFGAVYYINTGVISFYDRKYDGVFAVVSDAEMKRFPISADYFTYALGLSTYLSSQTYQIGDYVIFYKAASWANGYNNITIYRCNTANTTGTWDASKWDEKTYMEYLSDTLVGGALNGSY